MEEDAEAVDLEVQKSPIHLLKTALTIAKGGHATISILLAANRYRKSGEPLSLQAAVLLTANALLVALMTVYKFTSRRIQPLFLLQGLSYYTCFLVFVVLVTKAEYPGVAKVREKLKVPILLCHLSYAVVLVVGYNLCVCYPDNVYPKSFVMSFALFFGVYFVLRFLKKRGLDVASKEGGEVFAAQLEAFYSQYRFMVGWHLVEIFLGQVLFETVLEGAVYCTEDGQHWLYRSGKGVLFTLLHILGTMQGLGMTRTVFIKSAKKKKTG